MDYSKLTLMKMMQMKMAYLGERTDKLAHNVANVDTPGFKPRDLRDLDFKNLAMIQARKLNIRATSPMHHIEGTKPPVDDFRHDKMRDTYERKPIENEVVLEEQMAMLNETSLQYREVTNLYKKMGTMFKTAIGNR